MGNLLFDTSDEPRKEYWQTPHLTIKDDLISVGIITSDLLDRVWYCREEKEWKLEEEMAGVGMEYGQCKCGSVASKSPF